MASLKKRLSGWLEGCRTPSGRWLIVSITLGAVVGGQWGVRMDALVPAVLIGILGGTALGAALGWLVPGTNTARVSTVPWRFNLRTLLGATVLVACALAAYRWTLYHRDYREIEGRPSSLAEWYWTFSNGMVRHGRQVEWSNGQRWYECQWRYGKRHGKECEYWPNGKRSSECSFAQDRRHGAWRGWYRDGRPSYDTQWFDGLEHGTWKIWEEDGRLSGRGQFDRGVGRFEERDAAGHLHVEQVCRRSALDRSQVDSVVRTWNEKGELVVEQRREFREGRLHITSKRRQADGTMRETNR